MTTHPTRRRWTRTLGTATIVVLGILVMLVAVGAGRPASSVASLAPVTPEAITLPVTLPAADAAPAFDPYDWVPFEYRVTLPDGVADIRYVDGTFVAPTLGREMSYLAVLPPGYDDPANAATRYPAVYMLHGASGFYTEWLAYGLVEHARTLMAEGRIQPAIYVFPHGEGSFWVNDFLTGRMWGDYVATDVVQAMDARYRTIASPQSRALGGLSGGGTAALQIALRFPDVFGVVGLHSPAVRTFEERYEEFGDEAWFARYYDPQAIVASGTRPASLVIGIDIGDLDDWYDRTLGLARVLREHEVPYHLTINEGAHERAYWYRYGPAYLTWYDQVLAR